MEVLSSIWLFIQDQVLGMKWLNAAIGNGLSSIGLDTTSRIGGSVQFFIYDVIKITVLLCLLIFMISYIQSYFPPERSKKILGRFHGIGANIIAALLGTVTPFCSWGWLRKDYDESLNCYVVSFPDYSQMFTELFGRLYNEESSMERESLLTIYSHLFTYHSSKEKDNEILKSALQSSKALLQMLSNMQEGIRGFFEEMTKQKTFLGIQEVLVQEMNNTDSQKYAILTTTDSFYRYKEEVKELIDQNLMGNEARKQELLQRRKELEADSFAWRRNERGVQSCDEAMEILFQINREFDGIERRYNRLIDQKRVFAKRAAARIRYILAEGDVEEDHTKALIRLLNMSDRKDEILKKLGERMGMTERFAVLKERSFAKPRDAKKKAFEPQELVKTGQSEEQLDEFVVKPLYTKAQIREFRRQNEVDGAFQVTKDTVHTVEDLEKLLFVWQEATEIAQETEEIVIGEEFTTEEGLQYSGFTIRRK